MNYLAHLVLADNTPESLIGNLAGDFLQGVDRTTLHSALLPGIARHRAVDAFTDAHALTARSRARLDPRWRLYGRVLIDVFYDHFLAADFARHAGIELPAFATRVYSAFRSHSHLMPPRLLRVAPIMARHDWLAAYADVDGVGMILARMAQRTRHGRDLGQAVHDLRRELARLRADFEAFFPQLRAHVLRA